MFANIIINVCIFLPTFIMFEGVYMYPTNYSNKTIFIA